MYDRWNHIVSQKKMESKSEIVRVIIDQDHDGIADTSKIFADGFNHRLDGNAAGILALEDKVLLTSIPHLWELNDSNKDNIADIKRSLHRGYGVRVGVHGHDLHGLIQGPDGKIYFTVGDRGYDVTNDKGERFHESHRGAVFRCFPDGSGLEVFHRGLRNPQELAFNDQGDLFTVDNNMSGGDECRILHLTEDGDSGWDATFQLSGHFRDETNRKLHPKPTWFTERLWAPQSTAQPRWHNPAIGNLSRGPSGLAFYPGTGFSDEYKDKFFLADFVGNPASSYVLTFTLEPDGASYRFLESDVFAKNLLATDLEFAPDGNLYIADWITGWTGTGQGKIWKISPNKQSEISTAVSEILRSPLEGHDSETLVLYLSSPDRRVRYRAQFELVNRGNLGVTSFINCISGSNNSISKIHSLWGLGQLAEKNLLDDRAAKNCLHALSDSNPEVRAQAAKIYRWLPRQENHDALLTCINDTHPRVRYHAIMSAYKLELSGFYDDILRVFSSDGETDDHALRQAGICFLAMAVEENKLSELRNHPNDQIRELAVLALRRIKSTKLSTYFQDPENQIVYSAIRSAHDLEIIDGLESVAGLIETDIISKKDIPFPIAQRVINANFRLGKKQNSKAIAKLVLRKGIPLNLKLFALECLKDWRNPSPFDRVTWHLRSHKETRDLDIGHTIGNEMVQAFAMLSQPSEKLSENDQQRALLAIANILIDHGIASADVAKKITNDKNLPEEIRVRFFDFLIQNASISKSFAQKSAQDSSQKLRTKAHIYLADMGIQTNIKTLKNNTESNNASLVQMIIDELSLNQNQWANEILISAAERAIEGKISKESHLNLFQALKQRQDYPDILEDFTKNIVSRDPLGKSILAMSGGDQENGKYIFNNHISQCVRCHKINDFGGEAGPDLSRVGSTLSTREIIESIVMPGANIANGFGIVQITLKSGKIIAGNVIQENEESVSILISDSSELNIKKSDIEKRSAPISSMPPMENVLNLRELRDLVSYLSNLK